MYNLHELEQVGREAWRNPIIAKALHQYFVKEIRFIFENDMIINLQGKIICLEDLSPSHILNICKYYEKLLFPEKFLGGKDKFITKMYQFANR